MPPGNAVLVREDPEAVRARGGRPARPRSCSWHEPPSGDLADPGSRGRPSQARDPDSAPGAVIRQDDRGAQEMGRFRRGSLRLLRPSAADLVR